MTDYSSSLEKWSRLLIPTQVIQKRLLFLAQNLRKYLLDSVILSPVREGGNHFWDMLAPMVRTKSRVIPIKVVSYRDHRLPGTPVLELPDDYPARGNRIILLDDIVDTGGTQSALMRQLLIRQAKEVRSICLLDKPSRRRYQVAPEFSGFVIPNLFVFGCGMDWQGKYRELSEIRYVLP